MAIFRIQFSVPRVILEKFNISKYIRVEQRNLTRLKSIMLATNFNFSSVLLSNLVQIRSVQCSGRIRGGEKQESHPHEKKL